MIRLAHDAQRLDALCAEALDRLRLPQGASQERRQAGGEPPETIPDHANIRGGAYYSKDEGTTS